MPMLVTRLGAAAPTGRDAESIRYRWRVKPGSARPVVNEGYIDFPERIAGRQDGFGTHQFGCALVVTIRNRSSGSLPWQVQPKSERYPGCFWPVRSEAGANKKSVFEKVLLTTEAHGSKFKSPLSGPARHPR